LKASGQIESDLEQVLVYGELSLNGDVRPCHGSVLFSILVKERALKALYVPKANEREAVLISEVSVYSCETLQQVVSHLRGETALDVVRNDSYVFEHADIPALGDMADVQGQYQAKRALEIAAAGSHNIIMIGSPGSGKTMLARTFSTILSAMTLDEAIELTKLYSVAGLLSNTTPIVNYRPFRSPHHTSSIPSIVGGGSFPKPGEISLAHRGVLFLDELLEFPKAVLESLRQPLEDGKISVSRTITSVTYPAKFIFFAACNPCPCGYADSADVSNRCTCSFSQIAKYRKRLSGPILDRIDLHITVRAVPVHELSSHVPSESSRGIRARVQAARDRQRERFQSLGIHSNAEMSSALIKKFCVLDSESQRVLGMAVERMHLSARSYQRIIKVSRTIADLDDSEQIKKQHIAEALMYRFQEEL
jgi:magnesium chelatase family protein